MNKFVADNLVVFVEVHLGDVAFGELEVAGAFQLRAVERTHLADEALAEVFKTGTNNEAAFRESALRTSVNDLKEEFTHSGVDGIANEVCVERLEDGLAREDFAGHGG